MKTKKNLLFATLLLAYALPSCITPPPKDIAECTSNCTDVIIAGKVYEVAGHPLANVPINIVFKANFSFTLPTLIVATAKSNSNGNFKTEVRIDTTLFRDYSLHVQVSESAEAIRDLTTCDDDYYYPSFNRVFSSFDKETIENIQFEFYHLVDLTFNLQRTTVDSIEYLRITLDYDCEERTAYHWSYYYPEQYLYLFPITDSLLLHMRTRMDYYTKVRCLKKVFGKDEVETIDSVFCKKDSNNVYEINI